MQETPDFKNPFVGLRAFEEDEDYLFFGRSAEINDLLKKFSKSRFLAVIGSSGSGKSSLVKSGLLPAIHSGFLSVGHNWRVALMKPGNDPIGNLSTDLAREGVLYENSEASDIPYGPIIESILRRSSGGLMQVYKQAHVAPSDNLLIVIDQFEELFRFSRYEKQVNQGVSDALNFVNLLLNATQQSEIPVYVLITMRSDFLGDCAQFRGLPEAINDGQYLVPRMTRDEIREAISGPIAVGGAQITQRLLTRLLNDTGNDIDQLPILQHAMMRTWDTWKKRNKTNEPIDIDDYDNTGGMKSALSVHADEVYDELKDDRQKKYCELMFKALTDKAADARGTRRPKSVKDLGMLAEATPHEIIGIVENFRKPGRTFLMPPVTIPLDEFSIIDISHESLMRIWKRLKDWTEEETQSADTFKRLAEAAKRASKGLASLWTDPELEIGLKWREKFNNNEDLIKIWSKSFNADAQQALDFLKRSSDKALEIRVQAETEARRKREQEQEEIRKNRKRAVAWIISLVIFGILASMFGGVTYVFYERADTDRKTAIALRDQADSLKKVALKSVDIAKRAQIRDSLSTLAAIASRDSEEVSRKIAEIEKRNALDAKADAEIQKAKSDYLAKVSAVAQYQKLIRNFATEEDKIKNEEFKNAYKLVAYCNHLDTLNDLLKDTLGSKVEKINYELYDKLYFCLKAKGKTPVNKQANIAAIEISDTTGLRVKFNKNIIAAEKDTNDKILIFSTEDNNLYIHHYDQPDKNIFDIIPMGGQVTAIAYYAGKDIIYFGLKSGETGYIKYKNKNDGKYQPVFRNDLGSRITAVQFFKETSSNTNYFLATSYGGQAVVYELGSARDEAKFDSTYLVPNKMLPGIELPEYKGVINKAHYDPGNKRIVLVTSKGTYLWNPFADELLSDLKSRLDFKNQAPGRLTGEKIKFY